MEAGIPSPREESGRSLLGAPIRPYAHRGPRGRPPFESPLSEARAARVARARVSARDAGGLACAALLQAARCVLVESMREACDFRCLAAAATYRKSLIPPISRAFALVLSRLCICLNMARLSLRKALSFTGE